MLRKALFAAGLVCLSATANAAPPLNQGWYIGGALGASELDDDNLFVDNGVDLSDDEDTSITLLGGYKFNRNFAVEGRYGYLGEFDLDVGPFSSDVEVDVVSVHGVLMVPIGQNGWELFAQLGLGRINFDFDGFGDDDETVGSAGLGVRYYATENLGIAFQVDSYVFEADDAPNGRDYDVAVSTAQIAVNYIF